jgi:hypothetical protein
MSDEKEDDFLSTAEEDTQEQETFTDEDPESGEGPGEEDEPEPEPEPEPEMYTEPLAPTNTKKGQYQRRKMTERKGRAPEVKVKEVPDVPMATPMAEVDAIDIKNRPTVKVYERDGYSPRKRRAVSLGLSEKILPPFTKGVIARYSMLQSEDLRDPATGQAPDPQDAEFGGTYTLIDKYEADPLRRAKLMKNLGREEMVVDADGKEKRTHTINPIQFVAGIKTVNVETNYREYVFMELHPLNASNRMRPNDVTPQFRRIDLKNNKTEAFKEAARDLAIDAEVYVMKQVTKQELIIGYATAFGLPTFDRKISDIKMDLRKAAYANPIKFFSMAKDASHGIKMNIHDGISTGLIEYQTDKHRYVFCENNEIFHQVGIQEDPIESITKAIQKEESKMAMYDDLVNMLNYWEQ